MLVQNFIKLSAAVRDLSWSQRKKTLTKTIQSVDTEQTIINRRKTKKTETVRVSVVISRCPMLSNVLGAFVLFMFGIMSHRVERK